MTTNEFDFSLDDILGGGETSPEMPEYGNPEEQSEAYPFPYVTFLQQNTRIPGYTFGGAGRYVSVGLKVDNNFQGVLLASNKMRFWIVDDVTEKVRVARNGEVERRGGRTLWYYDPVTGERNVTPGESPICKSTDGKAPLSTHIGKQLVFPANHPAAGQQVIIGASAVKQNPDGTYNVIVSDSEHICENCPLSQWYAKGQGQNQKPLCAESWSVPVFFPPQSAYKLTGDDMRPLEEVAWEGGLALLQGHSPGVQIGIAGARAKKSGSAKDGRELPPLLSFYAAQGKTEVAVPKSGLRPWQHVYVVALAKSDSEKDLAARVAIEGLDAAEAQVVFDDPKLKTAVLRVNRYNFAPSGLPETIGFEQALPNLKYLRFEIVANNWALAPWVPLFSLAPDPVDPEDYRAFLKARVYYQEHHLRDQILFPENLERVKQRLDATQLLLEGGQGAALPAGDDPNVIDPEVIDDMG